MNMSSGIHFGRSKSNFYKILNYVKLTHYSV